MEYWNKNMSSGGKKCYVKSKTPKITLMINRLKIDFSSILLKAKNWKLDL